MYNHHFHKTRVYLTALLLCFLPSFAFATINADVMLENLSQQLPYLFEVVSGFSYLAGVFFTFNGLLKLKEYGETQGMGGSTKGDLKVCLSHLIIGGMLLYLPSTKNVLLDSVYGSNAITPFVGYGIATNPVDQMGQDIVNIVQFIGFIAFIRGFFLFHRVGAGQAQQGTFNKGVTHLLGGVIALNVMGFVHIIDQTLGIST